MLSDTDGLLGPGAVFPGSGQTVFLGSGETPGLPFYGSIIIGNLNEPNHPVLKDISNGVSPDLIRRV